MGAACTNGLVEAQTVSTLNASPPFLCSESLKNSCEEAPTCSTWSRGCGARHFTILSDTRSGVHIVLPVSIVVPVALVCRIEIDGPAGIIGGAPVLTLRSCVLVVHYFAAQ